MCVDNLHRLSLAWLLYLICLIVILIHSLLHVGLPFASLRSALAVSLGLVIVGRRAGAVEEGDGLDRMVLCDSAQSSAFMASAAIACSPRRDCRFYCMSRLLTGIADWRFVVMWFILWHCDLFMPCVGGQSHRSRFLGVLLLVDDVPRFALVKVSDSAVYSLCMT